MRLRHSFVYRLTALFVRSRGFILVPFAHGGGLCFGFVNQVVETAGVVSGFRREGRMTWVFDSKRFAKKVKHGTSSISNNDPAHEKCCPACGQLVVNETAMQEWPGLPAGVKFDPNDKELLDHLAAKIGRNGFKPHILIDEFIPTLDGDDGICYTHPEKLPGVKRDGSSCHFFHRPANAYTKGTRKRRKVHTGQNALDGETRWHKTGKTRPVLENGQEIGWKKIMVLYTNFKRKAKPNKTNWVMHQYHLGSQEDEREGELVVSKVFYQTQPRNSSTSKKQNASDDEECDQDGSPASFDGQPQASASTTDGPASSLSRPLPSTPDVVRPLPSREARIEILEPVAERASTPLTLLTEVSLNVSTPESTRCTMMKCTSNGATETGDRSVAGTGLDETFLGLLCNETLHEEPSSFADSHLAQNFRSFAADLGLTLDEDAGDLDNIVLGTPPDFLEDPIVSSQELWDWFGKRNSGPSSQERGDSQSGT